MRGSTAEAEDRANKVDLMAQAIVAMFGERSLEVVNRQVEAASADASATWKAILARVASILNDDR